MSEPSTSVNVAPTPLDISIFTLLLFYVDDITDFGRQWSFHFEVVINLADTNVPCMALELYANIAAFATINTISI